MAVVVDETLAVVVAALLIICMALVCVTSILIVACSCVHSHRCKALAKETSAESSGATTVVDDVEAQQLAHAEAIAQMQHMHAQMESRHEELRCALEVRTANERRTLPAGSKRGPHAPALIQLQRLKEELAEQAAALVEKDELIAAERERVLRLESSAAPLSSSSVYGRRGPGGGAHSVTAHDRRSQAHAILGVAERAGAASAAALARCAALRGAVDANAQQCEEQLDAEHERVRTDVAAALKAARADQSLHVASSRQRMLLAVTRQQESLERIVVQLHSAEAVASGALESTTSLDVLSYGAALDRCALDLAQSKPDIALPVIAANIARLGTAMRLSVDGGRWASARAKALGDVQRAVRDMVHAAGVAAPVEELIARPSGPATLRLVMAFAAPRRGASRAARAQWVRALIALEPAVRHHAPILVHAAEQPRRGGGVDEVATPATGSGKTTALLALTEVIAKDWVERNLALGVLRRDLWRDELHPWLATAALGSGSSAGVFSLVSSGYYRLDEGGVKATCRCDSYGGWCAVADRVFEPSSGRYAWRVQLAAPGKSVFIAGVCVHRETGRRDSGSGDQIRSGSFSLSSTSARSSAGGSALARPAALAALAPLPTPSATSATGAAVTAAAAAAAATSSDHWSAQADETPPSFLQDKDMAFFGYTGESRAGHCGGGIGTRVGAESPQWARPAVAGGGGSAEAARDTATAAQSPSFTNAVEGGGGDMLAGDTIQFELDTDRGTLVAHKDGVRCFAHFEGLVGLRLRAFVELYDRGSSVRLLAAVAGGGGERAREAEEGAGDSRGTRSIDGRRLSRRS